jgi:glucosylglycerate synthase
LAEESILTDDFLRELINVGEVDILIGVPTYNDADTVGQAVQALRAGLLQYFPRQRAVIINADGGSKDATQELIRAASISDLQRGSNLQTLRTLHCISTQYPGGAAGGTALHTILAAADLLRASACAVISADSANFQPEWIESLLRPVCYDNFDLVTPVYRRHKFDGLLVRNLLYPMTRAIYSRRIREPYPPEFAFSGRLAGHFLGQDIWSQDVGRSGAEFYLTIAAIAGGFRLAQSFLGDRPHAESAAPDLVPAMRRTAGVLFWSLEQNFPAWSASQDSQPVPTIGPEHEVSLEPLRVSRKRLHQMFVRGVTDLAPVLKSILSSETLAELERAAAVPEEGFCYSNESWVRTVYEFAAAYHKSVISRDHIVQALVPLYRGRTHTFLAENRDASADELESNVETLCLTFERTKPNLLEMWDGGK